MSYNTELRGNNTELQEILETINSLPEAGSGGNYDEGFADGKQAEYDRFWNAYQNNSSAMDYSYSFAGTIWDDDCYNPKHPINCSNCTNLFRNSAITDTKVTIDISAGTGTYVFNNCQKLIRIPLIIVNANLAYTGWLANCKALEEVYFEGTIGQSISFANSSLLTAGSINSICDCLSKTATGQTITFNSAVKQTYHEAYKTGWGTTTADETWDRLCMEHPNWTFVC